jgi:hypothetical protein
MIEGQWSTAARNKRENEPEMNIRGNHGEGNEVLQEYFTFVRANFAGLWKNSDVGILL